MALILCMLHGQKWAKLSQALAYAQKDLFSNKDKNLTGISWNFKVSLAECSKKFQCLPVSNEIWQYSMKFKQIMPMFNKL